MPAMDGTGPFGRGPQGRGRGNCGDDVSRTQGFGRGMGRRRGFRAGWGASTPAFSPDEEQILLQLEKSKLEARLDEIKQKLQG